MHVKRIHISNFMRTGRATLDLPPSGVVLVTGPNGAGKSTIVEAVSYALWGRTLRGTDPRRTGEAGELEVHADELKVTRSWSGNPPKSHVSVAGVEQFDTATKGQDYVESTLGGWDLWRRSCAFSSSDDLSFASATDAERKRLLETLLDLGQFDVAHERARVEHRRAAEAQREAQVAHVRLDARVRAERDQLTRLEAVAHVAPTMSPDVARARLAAVECVLPSKREALQTAQAAYDDHNVVHARWKGMLSAMEGQLRAHVGSRVCPTCRQAWPDADARQERTRELEAQMETLRNSEPPRPSRVALQAADDDLRSSGQLVERLRGELRRAEEDAARASRHARVVQDAKLQLLELEDQLSVAQTALVDAGRKVAHLDAVLDVLGTRGARAHLLSRALSGVEVAANAWLSRMCREPVTIKLTPQVERKSGGSSDVIGLEVHGCAGGRGYRGASGGERRRIDVALMLALAEVAQRSTGRSAPTMFFDEVFDALDTVGDPSGVDAICGVLDDLSRDRCVVIMTHNRALASALHPVLRVEADDGRLAVR